MPIPGRRLADTANSPHPMSTLLSCSWIEGVFQMPQPSSGSTFPMSIPRPPAMQSGVQGSDLQSDEGSLISHHGNGGCERCGHLE